MTKYHITTWTVVEAESFAEAERLADKLEYDILNIEEVVSVATIEIDGEQE